VSRRSHCLISSSAPPASTSLLPDHASSTDRAEPLRYVNSVFVTYLLVDHVRSFAFSAFLAFRVVIILLLIGRHRRQLWVSWRLVLSLKKYRPTLKQLQRLFALSVQKDGGVEIFIDMCITSDRSLLDSFCTVWPTSAVCIIVNF